MDKVAANGGGRASAGGRGNYEPSRSAGNGYDSVLDIPAFSA
ncbi:MAG: hypothetical protein R3E89_12320 [Thiolinea sp.]